MDKNFVCPIRIIHKHLQIPFSETYCRLAFMPVAGIREIYFYLCSPKKGMSNEFLQGKSKCYGGILLSKTSFSGRKNVKQKKFFKRYINLRIDSSHTNNKHSFGIIYFQRTLKCWHSLGEKNSGMRIFILHFRDGLHRKTAACSILTKCGNQHDHSLVVFLAVSLEQGMYPGGKRMSI